VTRVLPPEAASPSDLNRLAEFVQNLESLLLELLERPSLLAPYARELRASWEPNRRRLARIRESLESRGTDPAGLAEHGLAGDELGLKLVVFDDAAWTLRDRLRRLDARFPALVHPAPHVPLDSPVEEREKVPWRRRFRRRGLKKAAAHALAVGDVVLESVGAAVPHVALPAAGAGEFKQLVERVVGVARRLRRRTSAK
jgi:hypothetical protein